LIEDIFYRLSMYQNPNKVKLFFSDDFPTKVDVLEKNNNIVILYFSAIFIAG